MVANNTATLLDAIQGVQELYTVIMRNSIVRTSTLKSSLSNLQWRDLDYIMEIDVHAHHQDQAFDFHQLYLAVRSIRDLCQVLSNEVAPALQKQIDGSLSESDLQERTTIELTLTSLTQNVRMLMDRLSDVSVAAARLEGTEEE
jgi:hypothetical protein